MTLTIRDAVAAVRQRVDELATAVITQAHLEPTDAHALLEATRERQAA